MGKIQYMSFRAARKYAQALLLRTIKEWMAFCESGRKNPLIPKYPNSYYHTEWVSWIDFLGSKERRKGLLRKHYRPFEKARAFVRSLGINSSREWYEYCKSGDKPADIPSVPENAYEDKWVSWMDWLDSNNVNCHQKYMAFKKARAFARSLNFRSRDEWYAYCKKRTKPKDIPTSPYETYRDVWVSWADWLGK